MPEKVSTGLPEPNVCEFRTRVTAEFKALASTLAERRVEQGVFPELDPGRDTIFIRDIHNRPKRIVAAVAQGLINLGWLAWDGESTYMEAGEKLREFLTGRDGLEESEGSVEVDENVILELATSLMDTGELQIVFLGDYFHSEPEEAGDPDWTFRIIEELNGVKAKSSVVEEAILQELTATADTLEILNKLAACEASYFLVGNHDSVKVSVEKDGVGISRIWRAIILEEDAINVQKEAEDNLAVGCRLEGEEMVIFARHLPMLGLSHETIIEKTRGGLNELDKVEFAALTCGWVEWVEGAWELLDHPPGPGSPSEEKEKFDKVVRDTVQSSLGGNDSGKEVFIIVGHWVPDGQSRELTYEIEEGGGYPKITVQYKDFRKKIGITVWDAAKQEVR